MLDATAAKINLLVVHKVGNKTREEGLFLSKELHPLSEKIEDWLLNYFFQSFTVSETFKFSHSSDLRFNEIHGFAKDGFANRKKHFLDGSIAAAKHLYECSEHPKIKSGELYFAFFEGVKFQGEPFEAIGIFKAETKDRFIQVVDATPDNLLIRVEQGTNIRKLDKGCIIINSSAKEGYRILSVDNNREDTQFWQERFLNITPVRDGHFFTSTCLNMCQGFCDDVYSKQSSRSDQLLFLKRSVDYFSNAEKFDFDDFSNRVLSDKATVGKLREYKKDFENKGSLPALNSFVISKPTIKKLKRKFKNFIRLDTNIEVKLKFTDKSSASDFIERGFDGKKRMHYYKLYFNREF